MSETWWVDKQVIIDWSIVSVDDTPVLDATVTGTIGLPDGTTVAATIAHQGGTNLYRALYDPTMAGLHTYKLIATGTANGADEGMFDVRPSPLPGLPPTLDPSTPIGLVRLLIPDKFPDLIIFTDADITAFLTLEGSVTKRAVAAALEAIASNEAMIGKVIKSQDLSTDGARVSDALLKRAAGLRAQADKDLEDAADAESGGLDIVDFIDPFTRSYGEGC